MAQCQGTWWLMTCTWRVNWQCVGRGTDAHSTHGTATPADGRQQGGSAKPNLQHSVRAAVGSSSPPWLALHCLRPTEGKALERRPTPAARGQAGGQAGRRRAATAVDASRSRRGLPAIRAGGSAPARRLPDSSPCDVGTPATCGGRGAGALPGPIHAQECLKSGLSSGRQGVQRPSVSPAARSMDRGAPCQGALPGVLPLRETQASPT